jgi:hypothetical protein
MSNEKDRSHLYCACSIDGEAECEPHCGKRHFLEYLQERWPNEKMAEIPPFETIPFIGIPEAEWRELQLDLSLAVKYLSRMLGKAKTLSDNEGDYYQTTTVLLKNEYPELYELVNRLQRKYKA